jgi:hypothetical protein
MNYSIPEKRELTKTKIDFLEYLFQNEKPEWTNFTKKLKVIAKCGFGNCLTIMFGKNFDSKVQENENLQIDYIGKVKNGELVGISLFGTDKIPTELEFYSIDGKSEIIEIPKLKL